MSLMVGMRFVGSMCPQPHDPEFRESIIVAQETGLCCPRITYYHTDKKVSL